MFCKIAFSYFVSFQIFHYLKFFVTRRIFIKAKQYLKLHLSNPNRSYFDNPVQKLYIK